MCLWESVIYLEGNRQGYEICRCSTLVVSEMICFMNQDKIIDFEKDPLYAGGSGKNKGVILP